VRLVTALLYTESFISPMLDYSIGGRVCKAG